MGLTTRPYRRADRPLARWIRRADQTARAASLRMRRATTCRYIPLSLAQCGGANGYTTMHGREDVYEVGMCESRYSNVGMPGARK